VKINYPTRTMIIGEKKYLEGVIRALDYEKENIAASLELQVSKRTQFSKEGKSYFTIVTYSPDVNPTELMETIIEIKNKHIEPVVLYATQTKNGLKLENLELRSFDAVYADFKKVIEDTKVETINTIINTIKYGTYIEVQIDEDQLQEIKALAKNILSPSEFKNAIMDVFEILLDRNIVKFKIFDQKKEKKLLTFDSLLEVLGIEK